MLLLAGETEAWGNGVQQRGSAKPGTARGGGTRCPAQDAVSQLQHCNQTVAPQAAIPTWGCP